MGLFPENSSSNNVKEAIISLEQDYTVTQTGFIKI